MLCVLLFVIFCDEELFVCVQARCMRSSMEVLLHLSEFYSTAEDTEVAIAVVFNGLLIRKALD